MCHKHSVKRGAEEDGLDFVVQPDPLSVRRALWRLMSGLSGMVPDKDALARIELVLAEVLNNVVKHGMPGRVGGRIALSVRVCAEHVRCEIADNGAPFAHGRIPDTVFPEVDVGAPDAPEGGFGWPLIRRLSADLGYRRVDQTNHLTLTIPFCAVDTGPTADAGNDGMP